MHFKCHVSTVGPSATYPLSDQVPRIHCRTECHVSTVGPSATYPLSDQMPRIGPASQSWRRRKLPRGGYVRTRSSGRARRGRSCAKRESARCVCMIFIYHIYHAPIYIYAPIYISYNIIYVMPLDYYIGIHAPIL